MSEGEICKGCGHQRVESDAGLLGVCPKCNMPVVGGEYGAWRSPVELGEGNRGATGPSCSHCSRVRLEPSGKPSLFAAEGFIDQLGEAHTTAAGLFIVHGASLDYQTVKHQTVLRSAILNSNMRA